MITRDVWVGAKTRWHSRHLTLFAKTVVILSAELAFNALIWIITVIVFTATSEKSRGVLSLALVAWTTGLRHGLDADHISAIDNATRRIISVPYIDAAGQQRNRRPVTVGLFFSLGHSTIVVATIVAIAISAQVANHLDGFGNVGSVVGASISSSFLILIGCINCFILYRTWKRMRKSNASETDHSNHRFKGILTRIAMPLLRTVDRPWKLYPIGVLFGLGFDTASSIALLSVAIIAQQRGDGSSSSSNASVIILAFLFTAGMTLVDSIDSCLMIWAYTPDLRENGKKKFTFWETASARDDLTPAIDPRNEAIKINDERLNKSEENSNEIKPLPTLSVNDYEAANQETLLNTLDQSALRMSIILTLLSIIIAFAIGIIQLLGLIGDRCARCSRAADKQEMTGNGGLEGRWWLTWREAGDNFGYIGAAIVALFALSVSAYFLIRWLHSKRSKMHPSDQLVTEEVAYDSDSKRDDTLMVPCQSGKD